MAGTDVVTPGPGPARRRVRRKITRRMLAGAGLGPLLAVPAALTALAAGGAGRSAPARPQALAVSVVRPAVRPWGGRFGWPGGVVVSVAAPVPCTPAPDAAPARVTRAVRVRVTVHNGGREPFDTGQLAVLGDARFDGREAVEVIDTNGPCGNGGLDVVPVLPGRSCSYDLAYAVGPGPGTLRLSLRPGPGAPPVTFTGRA